MSAVQQIASQEITQTASRRRGWSRDSSGNLYGTTQNGGPSNAGTVFKVDPTGKKTVLYSFTGSTDGGYPMAGVVLDANRDLYGTTYEGGSAFARTAFKVDPTGKETVPHHKAAPTTSASCSRSIPRATKPCFTPSPEATAKPLRNPPPRQGGKPLWNYVRRRSLRRRRRVQDRSLINKQGTQKECTPNKPKHCHSE